MAQDTPQYDLVVLGATGFVGKLLCQYLTDCVGVGQAVQWAAAGRSQAKLDNLMEQLGPQAAHLPCLIADVTDESTLRALCGQTRVVVSTVGPYALRGEPLVKICAETGTDYCDLTGEPQWIRRMLQRYGAIAQQSGAHIVHCCGFDSVPSDLGVFYLQQQARERLGHPCERVKMRVKDARGGLSGGTAASGLNLIQEMTENPTLRQELANPYSLCPEDAPAIAHPPTLIPVQYDEAFHQWVTPFVMAAVNTRIVLRSNALMGHPYGPGFQYDEGILTGQGVPGWMLAQGLQVGLGGFALAAAWTPTRRLLQTVLPAAGEGPSPEEQVQGYYDLRFWGQTATGQTLEVQVTGDRDPGYGSTSKILGQAALCLAQDVPPMAKPGGFWTPASLLGMALIDRLVARAGLTFEVLAPENRFQS
jgi:short subunit dehydrogenase-like uncharacterized protein